MTVTVYGVRAIDNISFGYGYKYYFYNPLKLINNPSDYDTVTHLVEIPDGYTLSDDNDTERPMLYAPNGECCDLVTASGGLHVISSMGHVHLSFLNLSKPCEE
ncbi:hypothetical protein DWV16_18775 [Anaerotruncus sp. AF02-27]|nr:hypothetical protein DWV16_18775 [Anaerotruncus sp. AF02-27]